jgi:hypothetical protein
VKLPGLRWFRPAAQFDRDGDAFISWRSARSQRIARPSGSLATPLGRPDSARCSDRRRPSEARRRESIKRRAGGPSGTARARQPLTKTTRFWSVLVVHHHWNAGQIGLPRPAPNGQESARVCKVDRGVRDERSRARATTGRLPDRLGRRSVRTLPRATRGEPRNVLESLKAAREEAARVVAKRRDVLKQTPHARGDREAAREKLPRAQGEP